MNFNDLLKRADLYAIQGFIKHGGIEFRDYSEKKYSEQIMDAEKRISEFLNEEYTNLEEQEKISSFFSKEIYELEALYFEIGLLLGAKLATQLTERYNALDLK